VENHTGDSIVHVLKYTNNMKQRVILLVVFGCLTPLAGTEHYEISV